MSLTSVVYCSLETPARSADPYAHQLQTKPTILGLNFMAALMTCSFLVAVASCRGHSLTAEARRFSSLTASSWLMMASSV